MKFISKYKRYIYLLVTMIAMFFLVFAFHIYTNKPIPNEPVIEKPIINEKEKVKEEIQSIEVEPKEEVREVVEVSVPQPKVVSDASFTEIPIHIEVKAAGINQNLIETGLNEKGEMAVGETAIEIYAFKPPFDDFKNLLLSGHKDWKGSLGVLYHSDKWDIGTELVLTYENGDTEAFILEEQSNYEVSETPSNIMDLFNGQKRVTVITCDGKFLQGYGYEERIYNVFVEKY